VRILYLGPDSGTSRQRRLALERLGHDVVLVEPFKALPPNRLVKTWCFRTGALGLGDVIFRYVQKEIPDNSLDLVWVDMGELASERLVRALKIAAPVVVNFNLDNPFVTRDGGRWRLFHQAAPLYDLFVTPRRSSALAALRAGVPKVLQINQAADEIASRRISLDEADTARFAAEVVFVGTWMPERGPLLSRLIERGVPLRIYGPRWDRAREYPVLRPHVVLGELTGSDYAKAIQGAKIAIGLLSKGNEDLHTTRSMEIPAMGVLFCAERTSDHLNLYRDGEEAVFWDDADECADRCLELLSDLPRIRLIADAGRRRVEKNGAYNEPLLARVISEAMATAGDEPSA
jgi:spore maturation protein CgeB